ncbi:MAG: ATP-binding protein [Planctomycetes bacterium]|nr:ATP-binding protein [Planctomycetota bacterium]
MFVIAFAGLPGSGKSTLARAVGRALGVPVFDKDRVRAALFGPDHVEYSRDQDDDVSAALHALVVREARRRRRSVWVLDGRTYSRRAQVESLARTAEEAGATLILFHCVCSAACAKSRVVAESGTHPAANRTAELVDDVASRFERIELPHCVLDTERRAPSDVLADVLAHLAERGVPGRLP